MSDNQTQTESESGEAMSINQTQTESESGEAMSINQTQTESYLHLPDISVPM